MSPRSSRGGRGWTPCVAGWTSTGSCSPISSTELLPGSPLVWPEATFLAWLDCRNLDLHEELPAGQLGCTTDLDGPARMFLDRARVALTSGHAFGSGGAGFVRINYATNSTILSEALLRMARAVRTHATDLLFAQALT